MKQILNEIQNGEFALQLSEQNHKRRQSQMLPLAAVHHLAAGIQLSRTIPTTSFACVIEAIRE